NYRVMPVGRGRESLIPALRRVDYFIITKTNLASSEQVEDLLHWIGNHSDKPVLQAAYGTNGFRSVNGTVEENLRDPVYLISGVARPETIERVVADRAKVLKHKVLDDHHRYTHLEVEELLDESAALGARWIVTTAKDATKLSKFHQLKNRLWVIDLKIDFKGD